MREFFEIFMFFFVRIISAIIAFLFIFFSIVLAEYTHNHLWLLTLIITIPFGIAFGIRIFDSLSELGKPNCN